MQFAEIPAGDFQMGETDVAEPVHTVTISKAFYMGKYEVTQAQYRKIMGTNPSFFIPSQTADSSGYPNTDNQPVEQVSWFDCVRFCNALSANQSLTPVYKNQNNSTTITDNDTVTCDWSGSGYRLPTEAECEYACRANTMTTNYWGTDSSEATIKQYAWYDKNAWYYNWTNPHAEKGGTQPVGAIKLHRRKRRSNHPRNRLFLGNLRHPQ